MNKLTIAVAFLSLAGCASGGSPRGTPVEPGKVFAGSYINLKAPSTNGWYMTQSTGSSMAFGKEGPSKVESFIAVVSLFALAPTSTPSELEELIRVGARQDTPPERYEIQRETLQYTEKRGYPCVRYQSLSKDKNPPGSEAPLLLALDGIYCRHPKQSEIAFAAIFSFRGKTEYRDLRSEAEDFIQGVHVPDK